MDQQRPSSWVNLQDYLDLNQDQAADMGNKLNQSLQTQGTAARSSIGKATNAFQKSANEGAFADPNGKAPSGQSYNAMAAPTAAQANQMAATEYKGPRQLSDTDPNVSSAVGDAVARLNAAKTNAGAATLMRDATQSPSSYYGSTGGGLDALLAGQGAANSSLAATQAEFGGLGKELDLAATNAGKFGDEMYGRHEAARGAYRAMAPELQAKEDAYAAEQADKAARAAAQRRPGELAVQLQGRKADEEALKQLEDYKFWHSGETPDEVAQDKERQRRKNQGNTGSTRSDTGSPSAFDQQVKWPY